MTDKPDVLIAGAGFAGLGLAVALRGALGPGFTVALVDPTLSSAPGRDGRATAIAAAARRFFEAIDVWPTVKDGAQPILDMVITDSRVNDPIRPTFLTFAGEVEEGEPFAHMVEDSQVIAALAGRARALGVDLINGRVSGFDTTAQESTVTLLDGRVLTTRLLVAADGARSRLRDLAGIQLSGWDYGQSGVVTTVGHEREHGGRAVEHFLPHGPFARLPLTGNRSSVVWTETTAEANRIVALPPEEFHAEIEHRFGLELGDITVLAKPRAYPLSMKIARSFIADRLALVGDAAHIIHPIAGQGLNMGLRDVAVLAECVADTARLGLDIGAAETLERYQRWRRFDTVAMGIATDGLNRLFSNDLAPVRLLRDIGLGLVDRLPAAKRFFIREASGLTGETPRLMRGTGL
jgi:2-octaprenyl-6-methoxyphenol hydroxylase